MMRLLPWLLPALVFFKLEIFHFFISLKFIQWVLLLGIIASCLILFRIKMMHPMRTSVQQLKYSNLQRYSRELSKWARENDSDAMGKSLVDWLERNVFVNMGCIILSTSIFSHYPKLLTKPTLGTFFLLTLTIYSLTSLALRKEVLIFMSVMYILIPLIPYVIAFLSQDTGINMFETMPADIVYLLGIDISNLTQTAHKLFLFLAPCSVLIILFLVLSSVIVRSFLKLLLTRLIKTLQLGFYFLENIVKSLGNLLREFE